MSLKDDVQRARVRDEMSDRRDPLTDAILRACDCADVYGHEAEIAAAVADSLDAAWAEAEAALPEGWRVESVERAGRDVEYVGGRVDRLEWWEANAGGPFDRRQRGEGPTLAAALHALAERLRRP